MTKLTQTTIRESQEFSNFLQGRFFLSEDDQLKCDKYYLLYWSGAYLMEQIQNHGYDHILKHQDTSYRVRYLTPSIDLDPNIQYAISFRKSAKSNEAFAIIKAAPKKARNLGI